MWARRVARVMAARARAIPVVSIGGIAPGAVPGVRGPWRVARGEIAAAARGFNAEGPDGDGRTGAQRGASETRGAGRRDADPQVQWFGAADAPARARAPAANVGAGAPAPNRGGPGGTGAPNPFVRRDQANDPGRSGANPRSPVPSDPNEPGVAQANPAAQQRQQRQPRRQTTPPPPPPPGMRPPPPPPPQTPPQTPPPPPPQTRTPPTPDRSPIALRDVLLEKGIVLTSYTPGQHRIVCPMCGGGSTAERSLAVHVDDDGSGCQWMCHRATCEWTGGASTADARPSFGAGPGRNVDANGERSSAVFGSGSGASVGTGMSRRAGSGPGGVPKLPAPESLERVGPGALTDNAKHWADWLISRGISLEVAERNGVAAQRVFSPAAGEHVNALVFPYTRDGELVNIKYRGSDKSFWQIKGAEKIMFGLDDIAGAREIVIVEGEMDKLALEQAGIKNVVSVPDGAPGKVRDGDLPAPEEDRKFEYLWNCRAALDPVSRIVIAVDSDGPGQALAEELARRLGKERCYRVTWPEGCKDANDVLQKEGDAAVRGSIDNAEGFPLRGLFRFSDFQDDISNYFGVSEASEMKGVSTGWRSIDGHYRPVPGELTVVTGVPNSGKSEWVDALMCNLAVQHGWTFALCSLENKVHEHARKLVEKYTGEPWFEGKYGGKKARMRPETMRAGLHWLDNQFVLIRHEDDELPSVDWIIGLARAAVMRHGIRGLLIDPYNELDHKRPQGQTETEYVSQMLTRIKRFAQHYDVHVWFVAHPRQLHNWRGEAPGLYDISGSAHFINKCDNGIVVHRNRDEKLGSLREVTIHVAKVRNKVAGAIGDPKLEYNLTNGRYEDLK